MFWRQIFCCSDLLLRNARHGRQWLTGGSWGMLLFLGRLWLTWLGRLWLTWLWRRTHDSLTCLWHGHMWVSR